MRTSHNLLEFPHHVAFPCRLLQISNAAINFLDIQKPYIAFVLCCAFQPNNRQLSQASNNKNFLEMPLQSSTINTLLELQTTFFLYETTFFPSNINNNNSSCTVVTCVCVFKYFYLTFFSFDVAFSLFLSTVLENTSFLKHVLL